MSTRTTNHDDEDDDDDDDDDDNDDANAKVSLKSRFVFLNLWFRTGILMRWPR